MFWVKPILIEIFITKVGFDWRSERKTLLCEREFLQGYVVLVAAVTVLVFVKVPVLMRRDAFVANCFEVVVLFAYVWWSRTNKQSYSQAGVFLFGRRASVGHYMFWYQLIDIVWKKKQIQWGEGEEPIEGEGRILQQWDNAHGLQYDHE